MSQLYLLLQQKAVAFGDGKQMAIAGINVTDTLLKCVYTVDSSSWR